VRLIKHLEGILREAIVEAGRSRAAAKVGVAIGLPFEPFSDATDCSLRREQIRSYERA
jgi:hypothetical protein